jgi:hypothetical protein
MKKVATGLLALLLAGVASAQPPTSAPALVDPWVVIRLGDGALAWNLAAGRWFDNNDTVEGQRLLYFAQPQEVDGLKIVWVQEYWRIRCDANTYQVKSGEELAGDLQPLFNLSAGEPQPIRENSTQSLLKRVYCDNVEIDGAQHVNGILEAMDAMAAR